VPRREKSASGDRRPRAANEDRADALPETTGAVRGFWSGTLAFGLVSIPVSLVTAYRGGRIALRMLAPDGTPLARRFFSADGETALDDDDIVRGYPIEKDRYVVVTDEELEALAPKLSQEIDLRRFVPLGEIHPMYFERGWYLVPGKGSGKAYRLLAHVMEERERAGIATFVMRGKEYLVAIIARGGVLRAETLRFADELRPPVHVDAAEPDDGDVRALERAIRENRAEALETDLLADTHTERLKALIDEKRRAGKDVVAVPEAERERETSGDVVDLMDYLKRSLAAQTDRAPKRSTRASALRAKPHTAERKAGPRRASRKKRAPRRG